MSSSIEYGLVISSSLPMVVCGVGALGPAPRPSLVTTFAAAEVLGDTAQWLLDRVGAVVHVHSPAAKAVSCLEEGFIYLNQEVGRCPFEFPLLTVRLPHR